MYVWYMYHTCSGGRHLQLYTSINFTGSTCISESHLTSSLGESDGLQTTRWRELEQSKQE